MKMQHSLRVQPARVTAAPSAPRFVTRKNVRASTVRHASVSSSTEPSPQVNWDELGFGLQHVADTMYVATCPIGSSAWTGSLQSYAPLSLYPSAQVLNYGQSVFEGMKAQRTEAGHIVLFRPDCNAARMQDGAARLSMSCPSTEEFVAAVESVVKANASMVPPLGKGSLYLRPLLMGTGPILGLGPAPEYTFCVYCAAVGSYFKGGQLTPIDLKVDTQYHRSAPRGMGGTKAAGNYSPVLVQQLKAKGEGYSDVLYLDASEDRYLEEVGTET